MSQDFDMTYASGARKKRRPALACEQCRRRKIRCDRQTPCQPCTKANIESCTYVYNSRHATTTEPPFEAQDTQFSVFDQEMRQTTTSAIANFMPTATITAPSTGGFEFPGGQYPQFASDADEASFRSSSISIPEQPMFLPDPSALTSASGSLGFDQLDLAALQDSSPRPKRPPLGHLRSPQAEWLRGTYFKTRFIGQSHWMKFVHQSSSVLSAMQAHESEEDNSGCATFAKCKAVGKMIKQQENMTIQLRGSLRDMVPSREVADRLVQAYFRTFQTVFGFLQINLFKQALSIFWNDLQSIDETFCVTLLLVMSIGSTFIPESSGGVSQLTALQWISVASSWLSSQKDKARLNLGGVRIHCLLLLARQAKSVGGDTTWLSSSSLVRTAVRIGLHIDPEHAFPDILPAEAESRRRLWATILELETQSCMDSGGIPSIDSEEYDCALPSNVDEAFFEERRGSVADVIAAQPETVFTQSSLQILLMRSIPIRLKIARAINNFRANFSFEKVLALDAELRKEMKECSALMQTYCMGNNPPTPFQTKMFDLLTQRFHLALHHPFAVKALSNPTYYYSRKVCLETSLSLFSHLSPQLVQDDFFRLRLHGSGLFQEAYTQGVLYMCSELTDPFEVDGRLNPSSTFLRKEMRKAIGKYLELAYARIEPGDKSITRYVFFSCLIAQADAMHAHAAVEERITQDLKKSLDTCFSLLCSQVQQDPRMPSSSEGSDILFISHPASIMGDTQGPQQQQQPLQHTPQTYWSPWADLMNLNANEMPFPQQAQSTPIQEGRDLGTRRAEAKSSSPNRPTISRGRAWS